MGSVNSPLQSLDSLETHRFDEGVVRQALISEHSVPECDFVKLRGDEMQPDPATRPRQPSLDERRVMVAGIVQEDGKRCSATLGDLSVIQGGGRGAQFQGISSSMRF